MGTLGKKALSWEIDNFSKRKDVISSAPFSSGGCEWYVRVHPEGYLGSDRLILSLCVRNHHWLRLGWKRRAVFCFYLLNQSGEKLYTSPDRIKMFCAEVPGRGVITTVPLTKFQEKGFLEENKLTIQVYIKVAQVVHQGKSTANDMLEFGRFQIIASQVHQLHQIIAQHPDFAGTNTELKRPHMDLLLGLVKTLNKSPQYLYGTELNRAQSEFTELTEAGYKLDWLKSKLEEVSLERKKALADGSWVQQLEERVKNMELTLCDRKIKSKVYSFEFIDFFIKRFFLSCFSISKY